MAKAKYSEGEKILCFHGPLLYEAKCLQVEIQEGQMKYFVHYQGWNKNWDEWVTDARIVKFNAVGLQKQKELKEAFARPGGKKLKKSELQRQAYPLPESLRRLADSAPASAAMSTSEAAAAAAEASTATASSSSSSSSSSSAAAASAALAAAAASEEQQPAALTPPPTLPAQPQPLPLAYVKVERLLMPPAPLPPPPPPPSLPRLRASLPLPARLRLWLADDQDLVNNQCKLLRLPAGPRAAVCRIAVDFAAVDDAAGSEGFADGLVALFNASLGSRLLYKFERPQYAALLKSHRSALPASVYGAAHLLRLLACLPDLLPAAGLPAGPAGRLLDECRRFVAFLDQHIDHYLSVDSYEVAPPDYQRLALCI